MTCCLLMCKTKDKRVWRSKAMCAEEPEGTGGYGRHLCSHPFQLSWKFQRRDGASSHAVSAWC